MAFSYQSLHNCQLVSRLDTKFPGSKALNIWEAFIKCLEALERLPECSPDPERHSDEAAPPQQQHLEDFLHRLLKLSPKEASTFTKSIKRRQKPIEALVEWETRDISKRLFPQPKQSVDRFATAYYLAQLAYIFGRLNTAKNYAGKAAGFLGEFRSRKKEGPNLTVQLLEFLTFSLLLEIELHTRGWIFVLDPRGFPQAMRVYETFYSSINPEMMEFLREFAQVGNHETLSSLAGPGISEDPASEVRNYLRHYWFPFPTERDKQRLRTHTSLGKLKPLALRYALSRKIRAGLLLYRYGEWSHSRKAFEFVRDAIQNHTASTVEPALRPILHEANLYLGRLSAHECNFEDATKYITTARDFFESIDNAFVAMKALKYQAEVDYRRLDLRSAEKRFVEVQSICKKDGYQYDYAASSTHLGKILSRVGFQREALRYFDAARRHFLHFYDLHELTECLFWHAAAHARWNGFGSDREEHVISALALVRLYERLVQQTASTKQDNQKHGEHQELRFLGNHRDPRAVRTLLSLRLGILPDQQLLRWLDSTRRRKKKTASQLSSGGGEILRLLHRVVLLQTQKQHRRGGVAQQLCEPRRLDGPRKKYEIRNLLVTALQRTADSDKLGGNDVIQAVCSARKVIDDLNLRGGLVPYLAELGQWFVDRSSFVGLLLLVQEIIDERLHCIERANETTTRRLRVAFRDITKFLVLDRNVHLGPPTFSDKGRAPLWRRLQRKKSRRAQWRASYDRLLTGGHGIHYPPSAFGIGWVEDMEDYESTLRIFWLDRGQNLRAEEDFGEVKVDPDVVRRGRAASRCAPVLLVGRICDGTDRWTAHHIPDISHKFLFKSSKDKSSRYSLRLDTWQRLVESLQGESRIERTSKCSEVQINKEYERLAVDWFGNRLSKRTFEAIFGFSTPNRRVAHLDKADERLLRLGAGILSNVGAEPSKRVAHLDKSR